MSDAATSLAHQGLPRALLVRSAKQEPPSAHHLAARTSHHMWGAQEHHKNPANPSRTQPRAPKDREVMRGFSPAVAAWPRGGEARKLGQCGGRTHEHCQLMGMDLVWPTRWPRSMGASEAMARARAPTTLRLRDAWPHTREPFASLACCARTGTGQPGGEQSNADVETSFLARRTWRLLGGLFALCGGAVSYMARELCAPGFVWHAQEPFRFNFCNSFLAGSRNPR